jgi:hypothetical protein
MAARARHDSTATVRIGEDGAVEDVDEEEHISLARRLLLGWYNVLHLSCTANAQFA